MRKKHSFYIKSLLPSIGFLYLVATMILVIVFFKWAISSGWYNNLSNKENSKKYRKYIKEVKGFRKKEEIRSLFLNKIKRIEEIKRNYDFKKLKFEYLLTKKRYYVTKSYDLLERGEFNHSLFYIAMDDFVTNPKTKTAEKLIKIIKERSLELKAQYQLKNLFFLGYYNIKLMHTKNDKWLYSGCYIDKVFSKGKFAFNTYLLPKTYCFLLINTKKVENSFIKVHTSKNYNGKIEFIIKDEKFIQKPSNGYFMVNISRLREKKYLINGYLFIVFRTKAKKKLFINHIEVM